MCQSSTKIKHIIYNILIAYILQSGLGIVYINCQIYFSSTSAKGDMDVFKLHCDVFPGVFILYKRSTIIKCTFIDLTSREERGIKIITLYGEHKADACFLEGFALAYDGLISGSGVEAAATLVIVSRCGASF